MRNLAKKSHLTHRDPQGYSEIQTASEEEQNAQNLQTRADRDYAAVVALIFEAANDPRRWHRVLKTIVSRESLSGGGLMIQDRRLNTESVSIAVSQDKSRRYPRPPQCKTSEQQLRSFLRNEASAGFELFTKEEEGYARTTRRTAFSSKTHSRIGRFFVQASCELYIWFYIPEYEIKNIDSLVSRVNVLLPVIIGAYQQRSVNQNSQWQIDNLSQLLDQFEKAVLLVDARRRILHANVRGLHYFKTGLLHARENVVFRRQADTQNYAKALKNLFHRELSSRTWRESFVALDASGRRKLVQLIASPQLGSPDNDQYLAAHLIVIVPFEPVHSEFENTVNLLAENFDLSTAEREAVLNLFRQIDTTRSDRTGDIEILHRDAEYDLPPALEKLGLKNRYQLLLLLQSLKFNLRMPAGSTSDLWAG